MDQDLDPRELGGVVSWRPPHVVGGRDAPVMVEDYMIYLAQEGAAADVHGGGAVAVAAARDGGSAPPLPPVRHRRLMGSVPRVSYRLQIPADTPMVNSTLFLVAARSSLAEQSHPARVAALDMVDFGILGKGGAPCSRKPCRVVQSFCGCQGLHDVVFTVLRGDAGS